MAMLPLAMTLRGQVDTSRTVNARPIGADVMPVHRKLQLGPIEEGSPTMATAIAALAVRHSSCDPQAAKSAGARLRMRLERATPPAQAVYMKYAAATSTLAAAAPNDVAAEDAPLEPADLDAAVEEADAADVDDDVVSLVELELVDVVED
ncbi:hypothetical protein ON010_g18617 [Phytophthora cinnamomi]|nr:hypothetical protein ON010_g18617 [Phytophthora cinnamomi]